MTDDEEAATAAEPEATETENEGTDTADETEGESESEQVEEPSFPERIAAYDEELATEVESRIADLETELDEREERVDELESQLKRTQADFQNYKKRAQNRQERIQERATEDLVERLLDVRDNLNRALEEDSGDAESLREGVEMTLSEFDRVLDEEDVSEIVPEPGEETNPQRHEVMLSVESDRPEGTVDEVYTPGYEMGDQVLRPAQVTVSEGSDGE